MNIIVLMICGLLGLSAANAQEKPDAGEVLHLDLETAVQIALSENPLDQKDSSCRPYNNRTSYRLLYSMPE